MTLRQKMLLKELPNNNYNISKTAKLVGYSDNYANHNIHRNVVKSSSMKEYFTEATVKRDIRKVKKLVLKSKDYTNFLRATELESKILGMQLDKSEVTNKNPDKIIVAYGNRSLPTENIEAEKVIDTKDNIPGPEKVT